MEPLKKEKQRKLMKVLAAAHRHHKQPEPGDAWEMQVMRSIRSVPPVSVKPTWAEMFGSLFWPLCPVACALIIFLAAAAFRYDVVAEQDYAQIFTEDTGEVTLLEPDNG
ncbi:MAG: hypothetical protein A4E65_01147 [Syntrophorhabdus sp. PtaU1.Bin153]|nr:MAG: hypothetical protein A4E65_01147 [Syntrophorhabdus sp. PtaU1.Bin153]